jgi:3-demethoxyubiquinol 3-hydroxylase
MRTALKSCTRPLALRLVHTEAKLPSSAYFQPTAQSSSSVNSTPRDLTPKHREVLEAALRVDQAGEVAANYIYKGQLAVLGKDPATGVLIQVCWSCALYEGVLLTTSLRTCGSKKRNI